MTQTFNIDFVVPFIDAVDCGLPPDASVREMESDVMLEVTIL